MDVGQTCPEDSPLVEPDVWPIWDVASRHILPFLELREPRLHRLREAQMRMSANTQMHPRAARRTSEPVGRCAQFLARWRKGNLHSAELYLLIFGGCILAVFSFTYVLLGISSMTGMYVEVVGFQDEKRKFPYVGKHMYHLDFFRKLALVVLFRHLCLHTMEPLEKLHAKRLDEEGLNQPPGIVTALRAMSRRFFGRPVIHTWYSTFLTDHVLLIVVGVGYVCFQALLPVVEIQVSRRVVLEFGAYCAMLHGALTAYLGVVVAGFLLFTLEYHAVPRAGRQLDFFGSMSMCLILWSIEFLVVLTDRYKFLSSANPVKQLNAHILTRTAAATAMIFVTHSAVMLGAVLFGHACHFKKCPDLQWRTFFCRIVPLLGIIALQALWVKAYTRSHVHPMCHPYLHILAHAYPYFLCTVKFVGGVSLLVVGLSVSQPAGVGASREDHEQGHDGNHGRGHSHGRLSDGTHCSHEQQHEHVDIHKIVSSLFDYDAVLIVFTFVGAMIGNSTSIFTAWASSVWFTFTMEIATVVAPIGVALFTLCAWRTPAVRGTLQARFHWVALVVASTLFFNFQYREDCEISAHAVVCCSYPSFPDWNAADQRNQRCNIDERCQHSAYSEVLARDVYCLVQEEGQPGEQNLDGGNMPLGSGSRARNGTASARLLNMTSQEASTHDTCRAIHQRWSVYKATVLPHLEVAEEEEGQSTAYRTLSSLGQAGSVEFYFTIIGVLLKLVLLAEHPNAERILEEEEHHGTKGSSGKIEIVRFSRSPSWEAKRRLSSAVAGSSVAMKVRRRFSTSTPHSTGGFSAGTPHSRGGGGGFMQSVCEPEEFAAK